MTPTQLADALKRLIKANEEVARIITALGGTPTTAPTTITGTQCVACRYANTSTFTTCPRCGSTGIDILTLEIK